MAERLLPLPCHLGCRATYKQLGLLTYFTSGEKETRAWTIKEGFTAPQAAGVIRTGEGTGSGGCCPGCAQCCSLRGKGKSCHTAGCWRHSYWCTSGLGGKAVRMGAVVYRCSR